MLIALCRVTEVYDPDEMFEYAVEKTEASMQSNDDLESGHSSKFHEGLVSLEGLDSMISKFLGVIGEYSRSEIEEIFNQIDRDSSGFIDREEFDDILQMATAENIQSRESPCDLVSFMDEALKRSIHSTSHHLSTTGNAPGPGHTILGDDSTIGYMKKKINDSIKGKESPFEDWSIFYCGGSDGIKKNLQEVSKRYDIDLAVEKFDW